MFTPDNNMDAIFTLERENDGVVDDETFHILLLGDWSGQKEKRPLSERRPIEIDRDNFDGVMERIGPTLTTAKDIRLEFSKLDDLHPDEIFLGLPVFDSLRDIRGRLKNESTFAAAAREVRSWSGEKRPDAGPTAIETTAGDNLLDAILAKPQGGAPIPKEQVSNELGSLISEAVRTHLVFVDEDEQSSMIAAVDRAIGDIMRTMLSDASFRELEAAWRALFFLVRRMETSSQLKIFIFDVSKSELEDDLATGANLSEASVFSTFTRPASGEPWALVCGNYAFEPIISDVAALMRLAQIAATTNAPFISHMRPNVFGVESLAGDASNWEVSAETAEGRLWTALREIPEARYLGFAAPRFLARAPYGADSEPLETFLFEELSGSTGSEHYVWANSCFLAALLYAEGFRKNQRNMAAGIPPDVHGLPTHARPLNGETVFQTAAEAQLSESASDFLVENGMMPFASSKNSDRVRLTRFQSAAASGAVLQGRWSN
ncbi:MAG: type VI secretion system contractile sheath domain-containing protein [Pyrinomonadaceae bacterium]